MSLSDQDLDGVLALISQTSGKSFDDLTQTVGDHYPHISDRLKKLNSDRAPKETGNQSNWSIRDASLLNQLDQLDASARSSIHQITNSGNFKDAGKGNLEKIAMDRENHAIFQFSSKNPAYQKQCGSGKKCEEIDEVNNASNYMYDYDHINSDAIDFIKVCPTNVDPNKNPCIVKKFLRSKLGKKAKNSKRRKSYRKHRMSRR